ncbi:DEAD/DEAH box helicase [Mesorhizobium sp. B2-6-4]|uniref:DEAD/DEAH box helicase n=1 Tax=Mesorhizobium sp. B2-6-4 TaxID=2589913 RepID=UPI001127D9C8|nr:DEAD/DEAH box helicase [Mesorhizobium sp. B2-6-4]TPJ54729.1 DEAD/DEAH box helicase [Mesorhizobium sp. B2-6-4]
MIILPASGSEERSGFDKLHETIRRWIWERKWEELRDVQDKAIAAILNGENDVLIAAATAAGKTEAAFLPILTKVADRKESGFSVLYVSPLKALINDQFRRLDDLCERMEIDVVRWHGDAPQSAKQRARRDPRGLVLITPESIEAMLLRRPGDAKAMLASLDFIVVDELHAFLDGPRGLHLASLLRRLDDLAVKPARRIGLSATIGDLAVAALWLRPENPSYVAIVESAADSPELRLQVRAYADSEEVEDSDGLENEEGPPTALDLIADHVFANLRGSNNLAFAGSRKRVEALADRLRIRSEKAAVPNEFFPHHGSLSRELREELEDRLKKGDVPTTGVATTTLELGIDIGSVKSVAQIGAPRSLASLRQRLGRSGRRRGIPAVLRIYVRERSLAADSDPLDRLRLETVRATASVRLLIERFVEPPSTDSATATVVLHQTLSVIVQEGGARADRLYRLLCGAGPLSALDKTDYVELLRTMASPEQRLIEQAPDGTIMLGEIGEQLTSARDFYAIFSTDEEWRLVSGGRTLGTIPVSNPVGVGAVISFAGQRWRIVAVDDRGKVIEVERHRSGKIPKFDALMNEPIHDRLATEMQTVLSSTEIPAYLDGAATDFLEQGRAAYKLLGLDQSRFLRAGKDTHILTWRGTDANSVLAFALVSAGLECVVLDVGVTVIETTPDEAVAILRQVAERPPDIQSIAGFVENLRTAKFDEMVPETLLRRLWARAHSRIGQDLGMVAREVLASKL